MVSELCFQWLLEAAREVGEGDMIDREVDIIKYMRIREATEENKQ